MPDPVIGSFELGNRLRRLSKQVPNVVAKAMYEEMKIELKEAKRRTPVKTGKLQKSGIIYQPAIDASNHISVTISFGVPDPYYAIYVHENLEAFHKTGQAKFLESTLLESAPYMAKRIARRIDLERGL